MYATIRHIDPEQGWNAFRSERDILFKTHPQSPLSELQRERFEKLEYFPYDSQWRLTVPLEPPSSRSPFRIDLGEEGDFLITEMGRVRIRPDARLSLFWVEGYGGGLFLPFADETNGQTTYGGGRYASLSRWENGHYILDFNQSYAPYCAYNPEYICPLPPPQNRLSLAIRAGERAYGADLAH